VSSQRITIYVEGGSPGGLSSNCREGFRKFLEKAGFKGQMPKVVACGSRSEAYKRFKTAVSQSGGGDSPLLLVDSEEPIAVAPWLHVLQRVGDGWEQPPGAKDDHLHLMVQMMEAWFLADVPALKAYFGPKFQEGKLPKNNSIESISKDDIESSFTASVQDCPKKTYKKGRDSFEILGKIDPQLVAEKSRHAQRFLDHLKQLMEAGSHG